MTKVLRFTELEIWQLSRELANSIYDVSGGGEFSRDFALCDQIRKAALSPMSNIAEGFASGSDRAFCNYLRIAKASTAEIQSQLFLALDRDYIEFSEFERLSELLDRLARKTHSLMRYLAGTQRQGRSQ